VWRKTSRSQEVGEKPPAFLGVGEPFGSREAWEGAPSVGLGRLHTREAPFAWTLPWEGAHPRLSCSHPWSGCAPPINRAICLFEMKLHRIPRHVWPDALEKASTRCVIIERSCPLAPVILSLGTKW
jgi:hypothetical protein